MSAHRTAPADAEAHASGWAPLPGGLEVTRLPLVDARYPGGRLFARLTYRDALTAAHRHGATLPTATQMDQLHLASIVLPPHPLPAGAQMTSLEWSERHDAAIWPALSTWDKDAPVAGVGKHWIAGAPPGRAYLMGWWATDVSRYGSSRKGPGWVQQPSQPGSPGPHDDSHHDYGTTTLLVRPAIHDTDPAPRPGASWADAILGPLRTVGGWLTQAIATDGAQVVELPPHGWRCSVAELVADARALGTWHSAEDVRAGRYQIKPGDLLISARGGGDPLHGGTGHVERAETVSPLVTIGGNEGDTWTRAPFDVNAASFRGVIEYPPGLARRALAVTQAEAAAGIRERPGPLAHPRIQAYHAGARRGGGPRAGMPGHELFGSAVLGATASDEIAWCASGASSCCYEAAAG